MSTVTRTAAAPYRTLWHRGTAIGGGLRDRAASGLRDRADRRLGQVGRHFTRVFCMTAEWSSLSISTTSFEERKTIFQENLPAAIQAGDLVLDDPDHRAKLFALLSSTLRVRNPPSISTLPPPPSFLPSLPHIPFPSSLSIPSLFPTLLSPPPLHHSSSLSPIPPPPNPTQSLPSTPSIPPTPSITHIARFHGRRRVLLFVFAIRASIFFVLSVCLSLPTRSFYSLPSPPPLPTSHLPRSTLPLP